MNIDREEFLAKLTDASHALTSSETLEQSTCLVYTGSSVVSFNGELKVEVEANFQDLKPFAINGGAIKRILSSWSNKKISVTTTAKNMLLKTKGKKAQIPIATKIVLPYKNVKPCEKMKKVSADILTGLLRASRICGVDHSQPCNTHVHVTPNSIEATDGMRFYRRKGKTGMTEMLVSAEGLSKIGATRQIVKLGKTDEWLHLELDNGDKFAIRCGAFDYYDKAVLDKVLKKEKYHTLKVPKKLGEVFLRIADFNGGPEGEAAVLMTLSKNLMQVDVTLFEGGNYAERIKTKYTGPDMQVGIRMDIGCSTRKNRTQDVLKEAMTISDVLQINEDKILIKTDDESYVFCLE